MKFRHAVRSGTLKSRHNDTILVERTLLKKFFKFILMSNHHGGRRN
jgi:hypothetical protein